MKSLLRNIHFPLIVSIISAAYGIFIFALYFPYEGESRNDGIGFCLGFLGLPTTLIGTLPLTLLPSSWDQQNIIGALTITVCYFAQWQMIAWFLNKWLALPKCHQNING